MNKEQIIQMLKLAIQRQELIAKNAEKIRKIEATKIISMREVICGNYLIAN